MKLLPPTGGAQHLLITPRSSSSAPAMLVVLGLWAAASTFVLVARGWTLGGGRLVSSSCLLDDARRHRVVDGNNSFDTMDAYDDGGLLPEEDDAFEEESSGRRRRPPPSTESSSAPVHYTLVHQRPYQHRFSEYQCNPEVLGNHTIVVPRHGPLTQPGVVDFFPRITSNLSIAIVGDSVAIQMAQVLEEALWVVNSSRRATLASRGSLVVSGPVRGGGSIMTARVAGMLWKEMQTDANQFPMLPMTSTTLRNGRLRRQLRPLPPPWMPQKWRRGTLHETLNRDEMRSMGRVDVLVQRITFPWTPLNMTTYESLEHNTRMAEAIFDMSTLIYVSPHFCCYVNSPATNDLFREKLQLIENYTNSYVPASPNSTLRNVLLLRLDRLVDQLNVENARLLGLDVMNEKYESWMLSHYRGNDFPDRRHYHAQVCGGHEDELVADNVTSCRRNMNFVDGIHFCPSTLGGRIAAGISCLINCAAAAAAAAPSSTTTTVGGSTTDLLRGCERNCNDRYMSLVPVPVSDMVPYNASAVDAW